MNFPPRKPSEDDYERKFDWWRTPVENPTPEYFSCQQTQAESIKSKVAAPADFINFRLYRLRSIMYIMIDDKKLQVYFFFILFGVISVLTFLVYQPFLQIIALSAIFAVLLDPFYEKMKKLFRGGEEAAAVFVIIVTALFVASPIYFLSTQIFNESQALYTSIQENETDFLSKLTVAVERPMREVYPEFSLDLGKYLGGFADFLFRNIGPLVSGTAIAIFEILIVLIALFSFLKDGSRFVAGLMKLSPLDDRYDREILSALQKTINTVIRGTLTMAIIQGAFVGAGLYIFNVPNAALWGAVAAVFSLVPGVGTALVTFPAILYLMLINANAAALGLFLWSLLLVGTVDNLLAPFLYKKGINVHPLFIFFSVIGGLAFFGSLGFLFGPIILSSFIALLHIYRTFILEEKEE